MSEKPEDKEKPISELGDFVIVDKLNPMIYEIPAIMDGKFAKEFMKEYSYQKKELGNSPLLNVVLLNKFGEISGSNAWSIVLSNKILNNYGLRTINFSEMGEIRNSSKFSLNKYNVDIGFLVNGYGNPNKTISENFCNSLIEKKSHLSENPILIYPWEIEILKNQNREGGIELKLKEDYAIRQVPHMSIQNNEKSVKSFSEEEFIFERNSKIKLLTSPSGFTRVTLENDSILRGNRVKLDYSNDFYRMIIAKK